MRMQNQRPKKMRYETSRKCGEEKNVGKWLAQLPPRLATGTARVAIAAAAAAAVATTAATTTTVATAIATAGRSTAEAASVAGALRGASKTAAAEATTTAAVLAEISVLGGATAATASATTATSTTTTTEGRLAGNGLQEARNLLVGLLEKVNQLANDTAVATVEESSGNTSVSGTTGTTDTVNVVINVSGEIVVDNVGDVGDIETTSSDSGGDQDGASAVAEELQSTLTLALSAVTVNRGRWELLVDQEVGEGVGHALRLDEDQGEATSVGVEDIQENGALVNVLNILNLLGDVLGGGTNTTNGKEEIVLEEILGEHLDVAGEGGGKHESLTAINAGHVLALHDAANLGLETHVKHTIGLIEYEILDVAEGDATTLNEIDQSARGSNKKIAATLDLTQLRTNVGTTINNTRANPRAVGELTRLVVDLRDKLTGRGKNQRSGVSLALAEVATSLDGNRGRAVDERLRKNGEQETTSLSGTGLGASHEIATAHDNGDRVLLDRGGHLVPSELDVGEEVGVQRGVAEGEDGLRNITTSGCNGDVVVLLEVDTGVLLGRVVGGSEEVALNTGVGGARNVLSVAPLTIARTSGRVVTATAGAAASIRAAIGVGVEATTLVLVAVAPVVGVTTTVAGTRSSSRRGAAPVSTASIVVVVSANPC